MTGEAAVLVCDDGTRRLLALRRWLGDADADDRSLVALAVPPVLDIGCGPGRHVLALSAAGVPALGIDTSPSAVTLARARGACVLERSVFGRIPGAGRWGSALLLDGNAGIGGDPEALFSRVHALLRPGGRLLVEVEPPGFRGGRLNAQIHHGPRRSPWFPWAFVGADDIPQVAAASDLVVDDVAERSGRWLALLSPTRTGRPSPPSRLTSPRP